MKLTGYGIVKGAAIADEDLAILNDKHVEYQVNTVDAGTYQQRKGYFGVIIPQFIEELEAKGEEFPVGFRKKDVVHWFLQRIFATIRFGGKEIVVSTEGFSKEDWATRYEQCAKLFAEQFHKPLQMPLKEDENTR